ncbi:MAG: hypothetical protein D6705_08955 [Deltaproteobacteria bacterium]|nr:MAG: hypothetical protein D6705_08955 [Deltaproteobacteria bacterium]
MPSLLVATDDPFALAMSAAAGLAGIALAWMAVARLRGAGLRAPGWLLGLALVGFLGSAVAGTAERIRAARSEATAPARIDAPPPPPPPAPTLDADAPEAATGPDATTTDGPPDTAEVPESTDTAERQEPTTAEALIADMRAAAAEGDYLRVGQRYRVLSAMQPAPEGLDAAWKEVAAARTKAVKQWIADAVQVARGPCTDGEAIVAAFNKVRTVAATEPTFAAAKRAVRRLEDCRKKLERHTLLATKRARMDARRRFAEDLQRRIRAEHPRVRVTTGGKGIDARVRIAPIPADAAARLVDEGLLDEAQALGFGHVTFSDGTKSTTHDLEPRSDAEVAAEKLQAWGLASPLSLED